MKPLLEIAVFTLEAAHKALEAGADRIELCENPQEGGTTPSYGTLKQVRKILPFPVFPIIRPRGGDFIYSNDEKDALLDDLRLCRDLGFPGFVSGALLPNGHLDLHLIERIMEIKGDMEFTFHRAFDRCADPLTALQQLKQWGVNRLLSSGRYPTAFEGRFALADWINFIGPDLIIMPGSGINRNNVTDILRHTGAAEIHTAARQAAPWIAYTPPSFPESQNYMSVDTNEIRAIQACLQNFDRTPDT